MFYIFTLIYVISLCYILIKKRAIDLYTILFGGLFYYSMPLIIGKITLIGVVMNQPINYLVYIIYSFAFIVSFIFMFKSDKQKIKLIQHKLRGELDKTTSKRINVLTALIFLVFLIGVYQIGFSNYLNFNKNTNEERLLLIQFSVVLSMIMLPVSLYYRKLITLGVYFLILFSFLLYGSRSYFVVAIISSVFIQFRFKEMQLIKKLPLFILGVFFAVAMAIYKFIYTVVKVVDFKELSIIIRNLDYDLVMSQLLGDPMAVVYNLNYTIVNELDLSISYLFHRILSIMPGGGSLFSFLVGESYPRYSYILNELEYTNIEWGLASSLYAELIAISGFTGFFIIYILMNNLVNNFNNNIRLNGLNFYNLLFISSYTYLLFYSHRLDITFVLGVFKYCILLWILFKYVFVIKQNQYK